MNEIKCPKCGEVFTVDEKSYAAILTDVRNKEFNKDVNERVDQIKKEFESEKKLALNEKEKEADKKLNDLNQEIATLKAELKSIEEKTKKEAELEQAKQEAKVQAELAKKDAEIEKLKNEITINKANAKNELIEAVSAKNSEIATLNSKINSSKEEAAAVLRIKEDEIERLKDMKSKLNNKLVGESLEQHCLNEFNTYRTLFGKGVYFEKDNDDKDGTKGDFIYRETTDDDIEVLSIMFEMKNETDESVNKHKNEDFFKKLDSDRKKKNCEYAVLVSLLESDNDYYNNGIVDVSHKYEKMYVIRPQFFMPLISLLRNAAINSLEYKREIAIMKNEQIDITNFEKRMEDFKTKFGKNYDSAKNNFDKAIDEIDKAIANLNKVKDSLTTSSNQLRLANEKAQDLTIKSLVKDSPLLKAKFEEIE